MAKTNIVFNNKNYSIDDASISTASASLKSHLSTVMNGSGAVINLGGTSYNVDSTKLSAATNAFVSHLGTVAGIGYKVVVGSVEYGVDSGKMADAIGELETVLDGLNSSDGSDNNAIVWDANKEYETFVTSDGYEYFRIADYSAFTPDQIDTVTMKANHDGQIMEVTMPLEQIGSPFTYEHGWEAIQGQLWASDGQQEFLGDTVPEGVWFATMEGIMYLSINLKTSADT